MFVTITNKHFWVTSISLHCLCFQWGAVGHLIILFACFGISWLLSFCPYWHPFLLTFPRGRSGRKFPFILTLAFVACLLQSSHSFHPFPSLTLTFCPPISLCLPHMPCSHTLLVISLYFSIWPDNLQALHLTPHIHSTFIPSLLLHKPNLIHTPSLLPPSILHMPDTCQGTQFNLLVLVCHSTPIFPSNHFYYMQSQVLWKFPKLFSLSLNFFCIGIMKTFPSLTNPTLWYLHSFNHKFSVNLSSNNWEFYLYISHINFYYPSPFWLGYWWPLPNLLVPSPLPILTHISCTPFQWHFLLNSTPPL